MTGIERENGVATLRQLVSADDIDFIVQSSGATDVELDLVIHPDACVECIMPVAHLEALALQVLHGADPSVRSVRIRDKRDH
jgi:hypothetical protein